MNEPPSGWAGHARRRRLIFLHIPKTAGTSVAAVLTQHFCVDEIATVPTSLIRPGSHPATALAGRTFRLFGIGQHFDHDNVAALRHALQGEEPPFVFTILREPRSRLISQYLHWRRTGDVDLAAVDDLTRAAYLAARELPIGDFLNTRTAFIIEHFRNYQTRILAGFGSSVAMSDEQLLETAFSNVSGYDLVGTTSQCEAAVEMLSKAYGWPSPGVLQSLNVLGHHKPHRSGLTTPPSRLSPNTRPWMRRCGSDCMRSQRPPRRTRRLAITPWTMASRRRCLKTHARDSICVNRSTAAAGVAARENDRSGGGQALADGASSNSPPRVRGG
jgi:hypothetical protein